MTYSALKNRDSEEDCASGDSGRGMSEEKAKKSESQFKVQHNLPFFSIKSTVQTEIGISFIPIIDLIPYDCWISVKNVKKKFKKNRQTKIGFQIWKLDIVESVWGHYFPSVGCRRNKSIGFKLHNRHVKYWNMGAGLFHAWNERSYVLPITFMLPNIIQDFAVV